MRMLWYLFWLLPSLSILGQDRDAEFPGGTQAMTEHIERHMRYPQDAAEMRLQGKVHLKLEIDSTGKLTLATVARGLYPQLDAEALRLVHTFPDWLPALKDGRPCDSQLYLSIRFDLSDLIGQPADVAFSLYRQAIQAKKGEQALSCLHPHSIRYFDSLAAMIKYGNEAEIKASNPYEMATVLCVRQWMERKTIKKLDGRTLFVYLVEKGIIGKSSVGNEPPIDFRLKNGVVYIQFQDDYYVHLRADGWNWLVDLTLSLDSLNENIRLLAKSEGMELVPFIISSVEARTGTPLASKIWRAPFSK